MPAAHKGAPVGSLGLRTPRERLIRTKPVHEIYGHLDRRRRGREEDIARALRPGLAVRPGSVMDPYLHDGALAPTPYGQHCRR
jgi:hypothetical protein